ncbi:MAG TPA: hypothetical protein VHC86_09465 [Opitutaceae bacterium]|nr:hypothetical protein [Opitutaceae bacterium]
MNTPRELLLAHHRRAARRIGAARRRLLLEALPRGEPLWWWLAAEELFLPQRTFWAALAAVWILILGFRLSTPAPNAPARSAGLVEALGPLGADPALLAQIDLLGSDRSLRP